MVSFAWRSIVQDLEKVLIDVGDRASGCKVGGEKQRCNPADEVLVRLDVPADALDHVERDACAL